MALHYSVNRLAETFCQVSRSSFGAYVEYLLAHVLTCEVQCWKMQMPFDGERLFCQILGHHYQGRHE